PKTASSPNRSETLVPTPSNVHEAVVADWSHPFSGHGIQVETSDAAQRLIQSFTVHDPKGLGDASIFVSPDTTPDSVIFVFDPEGYGKVWVVESAPSIADPDLRLKSYQALVNQNGTEGFFYTFELDTIRGKAVALAGSSSDPADLPTKVEWVEG